MRRVIRGLAIGLTVGAAVGGVTVLGLTQGTTDEPANAQVVGDRPVDWSTGDAEVLGLDQRIADAVVRGDTHVVRAATSADFVMVHGDGWTNGGQPLSTDTQETMLRRVEAKHYDVLHFDSVKAELHGDVAITHGRYIAHVPTQADPGKRWFAVWFERVYARRAGQWIYLSHRTVHGPTYGPDRTSLQNK